jgi:hypothetical protein
MYITDKEYSDLHASIDFISSNIDGAEDQEYYQGLVQSLYSLFNKAKKQREYQSNARIKKYVKRVVAKKMAAKN